MATAIATPAFLGVDAGTTAIKAGLFDLEGNLLALGHQEYQLETPGPRRVELDAEIYWRACRTAVRQAVQQSHFKPEQIVALAIASQGETLIPVDDRGAPTRKAIVWLDNRAISESEEIADQFDPKTVYQTTGQPTVAPTWPACKLLWLKRREPDVFASSTRFLLLEDYLLWRLTGNYFAEYSLHTSSLWLDIQEKRWWEPMLDYVGIRPSQLGVLTEPGAVLGQLCKEGAQALGLSSSTMVVSGGLDQTVGALGAGNFRADLVSETTGGALGIVATTSRPLFDPSRRIPCHYHARPDFYCLLPWGQTAGMALRWFRDNFYQLEKEHSHELNTYELMTQAAATVPAGSDGLLALPHLEGAACPEFNAAARAVFFGASLQHTRAHFVRAILESVAYMLKKNLDLVGELGIHVDEIRSLGGGARSPLWLQIKADVLQKPVSSVKVREAACLGGAMLGTVATGHYVNLAEAQAHMVQLKDIVEPNAQTRQLYQEGYERYLELYERLAPMFNRQESER